MFGKVDSEKKKIPLINISRYDFSTRLAIYKIIQFSYIEDERAWNFASKNDVTLDYEH